MKNIKDKIYFITYVFILLIGLLICYLLDIDYSLSYFIIVFIIFIPIIIYIIYLVLTYLIDKPNLEYSKKIFEDSLIYIVKDDDKYYISDDNRDIIMNKYNIEGLKFNYSSHEVEGMMYFKDGKRFNYRYWDLEHTVWF